MKKQNTLSAFTLIELLVSMTIFSIIMVSVMMIYITATDISKKYDINREMRNNIKSVVEDIAEEVRKGEIKGVANSYGDPYIFGNGTRLKLKNGPEYRLVKYNKSSGKKYEDLTPSEKEGLSSGNDCLLIKDMCRIVKFDKNGAEIGPLSNSKISFTNLKFAVSGENEIPQVKLNFVARAAIRAGIRAKLAEKTTLIFQTTLSSRALKVK